MNRTDRLLALVLELQNKGRRRAADLAATFETSKRTIYRDIQALCQAGVPVVSLPGQGYSLMEGYFLPPVSLSTDEATMLLLGSDFMAQNFDAQYRSAAHSASRKIEAVLTNELREEVHYLQSSISFHAADSSPAEAETLKQLRRAVIEQRRIRFDYHTRFDRHGKSARNLREADPYGLVHYGYSWYLIAHCHLRKGGRVFRLVRIANLEILEERFDRPRDFNLQTVERNERDDQRNVVIKALFDKTITDWVRESPSYYIVEMEDTSEGLLVTMKVHVESEVLQWLLSWGGQARVIEPESLRKRLASEAKKMLENYCERC